MQPGLPSPLSTERLLIRPPEQGDAADIARFYQENEGHLGAFAPLRAENSKASHWEKHIPTMLHAYETDSSCSFFLFSNGAPEIVIGFVNYFLIIRGSFQSCVLGYALAAGMEGKGLMREALSRTNQFMFSEKNLHRIEANYHPRNLRSGRLLRGLGFREEGLAEQYLIIRGRWEPHWRCSLTYPHWQPLTS